MVMEVERTLTTASSGGFGSLGDPFAALLNPSATSFGNVGFLNNPSSLGGGGGGGSGSGGGGGTSSNRPGFLSMSGSESDSGPGGGGSPGGGGFDPSKLYKMLGQMLGSFGDSTTGQQQLPHQGPPVHGRGGTLGVGPTTQSNNFEQAMAIARLFSQQQQTQQQGQAQQQAQLAQALMQSLIQQSQGGQAGLTGLGQNLLG